MVSLPCPCGKDYYASCCGRYHSGMTAPDAEALIEPLAIRVGRQQTPANSLVMMRSRYSAYVLKLKAYLLATWHVSTRPVEFELAADKMKWLGLEVKNHRCGPADRSTVEFVARYKVGGRAGRLHEISRFVREDGKWLYVDGEFIGPDQ